MRAAFTWRQAEVLIGATAASCLKGSGKQGLAYLYFVSSSEPAPLVFQPDAEVDPADFVFGSDPAIITSTEGTFVFIGEHGRDDIDGLTNVGLVYIYEYTGQ